MTTHYDTLGVPIDADDASIKKAFRHKAKAAHPDREGGDANTMAAVNRAYEVLSDPDRRAYYDASGQDMPNESPLQQAEGLAMQALAKAIGGSGNAVKTARSALDAERAHLTMQARLADQQIENLTLRRAKLGTKRHGKNLAHMVIDQQIADVGRQKLAIEARVSLISAAIDIVAEHTDAEADVVSTGFRDGSVYFARTGQW